MGIRTNIAHQAFGCLLLLLPLAQAQDAHEEARQQAEKARRSAERGRAEHDYERGARALEKRDWQEAIERFREVVQRGGARADGALYWVAYAQHKSGRRDEALATLDDLAKLFPGGRWIGDAKALELEIRQSTGESVALAEVNEELKLTVLNSLQQTDPERVTPILEKLLQGSGSPRLKERALFVLAQSPSPRAREILLDYAKGKSNPDLQLRAVRYMATSGGKENPQMLADIYAASNDLEVKRTVLRSFAAANDSDRLIAAMKEEKDPELRREIVRLLGRNQDPRAREALMAAYASDAGIEIRMEAIRALAAQRAVTQLIDLARKENDPAAKREIVRRLSSMKSKEATDFLLELLSQ